MNGIDISKWQKGINLAAVPCDFVIVKATQGVSYTSPEFKTQISQAMALGKLIGVYHYAGGGGAIAEAEYFLSVVREYIGKAILVLDWEGDQNPNFSNPGYAKAWLEYVKQKTDVIPFIYMSKSVCRQYKWDASFPLWCAQYKNQQPTSYQSNPWTDTKGFGAWAECAIFQYSSKGRLEGYNHNLDLDKAYINEAEWIAYAQGDVKPIDLATKPTLRKGDRNEYVRAWQTLLDANGYKVGKIDGIFGDKTEQAVIKWQQAHGMEAGYIGPQTWETI
jgi:lysozyme